MASFSRGSPLQFLMNNNTTEELVITPRVSIVLDPEMICFVCSAETVKAYTPEFLLRVQSDESMTITKSN